METTRTLALLALTAVLLSPDLAQANDGTPPWIHEAIQEGQDVRLVVGVVDNGEPGWGDAIDVFRDGKVIFDDERFHGSDALSQEKGCRGWDTGDYCEDEENFCEDCDEDGTPECAGWCETTGTFELVDKCVPAGEHTWSIGWWESDPLFGAEVLEVTRERPCVGGCSCGTTGPLAPWLAGLGLLVVGLAALRRRGQASGAPGE